MPAFANNLPWSWSWSVRPRAALTAAVFTFLDVVDVLLCSLYAILDAFLEENPAGCYCYRTYDSAEDEDDNDVVSDTLYVRRSACRDALTGILGMVMGVRGAIGRRDEPRNELSPRWSDCGCASCGAWRKSGADGRLHLHYVVQDAAATTTAEAESSDERGTAIPPQDAIFIHGFASSSSFWTETVFLETSAALMNHRLIAVDLLGFGESPKPVNCAYRLRDHVEAIERSVVEPLGLRSFHLVGHSMGCIVALALAAKHPERVKSITLVAPPYLPREGEKPSQVALRRLSEKKLWPPMQFGSAVMSWYEHIGRTVCLLVCKNHRVWEWIFNLLTRKSGGGHFVLRDLTRHTHHSGWHTMHNVICGGAMLQERNVEAVAAAGVPVRLVHGDRDKAVPVECSHKLVSKLPHTAELRLLRWRGHMTVVFGRETEFAQELGEFISASSIVGESIEPARAGLGN